MSSEVLEIHRGAAPMVLAMPHTGLVIPDDLLNDFVSPWLARKDTDWWVDQLYGFAADLDVTTVRTTLSRSVIDMNRDPSGASLYPGRAGTDLCPTTTFDGEPLYWPGRAPDGAEIDRRREAWFAPYHAALAEELQRLRRVHPRVVLYDAHSIRSAVPRLFEGDLPQFNLGTNGGASCDGALTRAVEAACARSGRSWVTDGRFKGGWTTRHHGAPADGVHAIQMELACRGYMDDPPVVGPDNWPSPYRPEQAASLRQTLQAILQACLAFVQNPCVPEA